MTAAANRILILGGGLVEIAGQIRLSAASEQRVDRAVEYFHANSGRFRDPTAWVICTGGCSGRRTHLAPVESREGPLMRRELVRHGVPESIIRVEADSRTTVTNFANCLERGLLDPRDFGADRALGIVTHPHHMRRARHIALTLGIPGVHAIPTRETDSPLWEIAALLVTTVGTGSVESLRRREELITRIRHLRRRTLRLGPTS